MNPDLFELLVQLGGSPGELSLLLAILWRLAKLELASAGREKRLVHVEAEQARQGHQLEHLVRIRGNRAP